MTEITMPRLSDSMEQGTILTWLKADGDHVLTGEDLVEIETDKATVTHPASVSGILAILVQEGTTLPVGAPIARVADIAGATTPGSPDSDSALADARRPESALADARRPDSALADARRPDSALADARRPDSAFADARRSESRRPESRRGGDGSASKATPLARRVARAHGVSLDEIAGTGPLGRITRGDVLATVGLPLEPRPAAVVEPGPAASAAPAVAAPVTPEAGSSAPVAPEAGSSAKGELAVVELTRLQALVARRMAEAKATIPHFQVQTEVTMDAASALREAIKQSAAAAPSFNDLIVKAAALALREHPQANGTYRDGRFELHARVNVGIAVAADRSLVVPTIFDADQKSLGAIATAARTLATRVRDGTVTPAELSGATFTVSNLGMHGMTAITPVINPPQAAILGVGAIREVLARDGGEIVDRRMMTLTLSCDHRILYGAEAAQFLSMIRELLEHPLRLVL